MAVEIDQDFKEIIPAKRLDLYYIPTRYPNGLPGGIPSHFFVEPKEAEDAMILAKSITDLVKTKLDYNSK